eukprot:6393839-Prymnesium_polylepis.1
MAVGWSGCLSGFLGLSDRLSGLSGCRTRSRTCGRAYSCSNTDCSSEMLVRHCQTAGVSD